MKYYSFWELIRDRLLKNIDLVIMLVANHEGSSPGKQGFKMFIDSNRNTAGTIGGGIMEVNIIKLAEDLLESKIKENQVILQVHNKKANTSEQSGLICAGKQWILLYRLNNADLPAIMQILESYDTLSPMRLRVTKERFEVTKIIRDDEDFHFDLSESWVYYEKIGDPFVVHVFGGGHVGNAITRILRTLNFYIVLYENRSEFTMFESNKYPHMKIQGSYLETTENVKSGPKVFIVVTTHSFDTDYQVLMGTLEKKVNYIGLMGSKTKIAKIFQMLRDDGFDRGLIDLIKAPIGLDISDGSIEEIAVSVTAELLKIKNNPDLGIY